MGSYKLMALSNKLSESVIVGSFVASVVPKTAAVALLWIMIVSGLCVLTSTRRRHLRHLVMRW
jgi:hypothetical protein